MENIRIIVSKEFGDAFKQVKDLIEITSILITDIDRVINISDEKIKQYKESTEENILSEQQTWIRLSIRLLITSIESTCFKLKQIALIGYRNRRIVLDEEDNSKLTERTKDGRPKYLPTDDNLKYSFKMLASAFDIKNKLKCGKEWGTFLRILKKRNGLTHPKDKSDLQVSQSDRKDAADTMGWFFKFLNEQLSQPLDL